MYCQNCGSQVTEGMFCSKCGTKAIRSSQQSVEYQQETLAPSPQDSQPIGIEHDIKAPNQNSNNEIRGNNKPLGVCLIISAVFWFVLCPVAYVSPSFFISSIIFTVAALPAAITLLVIGLRERRDNKGNREKKKYIGLEKIIFAVAMITLGIGYCPVLLNEAFLLWIYGTSMSTAIVHAVFAIFSLISLILVLALYIRCAMDKSLSSRNISSLKIKIMLLAIFIVGYNIIFPIVSDSLLFEYFSLQLAAFIGNIIVNIPLMILLIIQGREFLPKREKFANSRSNSLSANQNYVNSNDSPSMGLAVLSFLFPVVGLILFIVWKDGFPLKAKSCGKGALIGVIVEVLVAVLFTLILFLLPGIM